MAARTSRARFGRWAPIAAIVALGSLLLAGIGLVWLASEAHYNACIARANADYPAVPVSAFARSKLATGPVKVSFVRERAKALKTCHHF